MLGNNCDIKDVQIVQAVVQSYIDTNSVKRASEQAGVSEVKARRILITEGLWSSDTSLRVGHYVDRGFSTEEIAQKLHITIKAVQQYLPYSRGLYLKENRSMDAEWSSEYRIRIKTAREKVLKRRENMAICEGWEENENMKKEEYLPETLGQESDKEYNMHADLPEFEQYPGIVCLRTLPDDRIDLKKAKAHGEDIIRLHLELISNHFGVDEKDNGHATDDCPLYDFSEEEQRVLREYGGVKYGKTISRDVLVPDSLPLYALHYLIQACFGWENSHLHCFELPPKQYASITDGTVGNWSELVGVVFRSPFMGKNEEFWADDYERGSFKNWLRKKYTGPYVSLCHGEGIFSCKNDMERYYDKDELIMVDYSLHEGALYVSGVHRAPEGAKVGPVEFSSGEKAENLWGRKIEKREILKLSDCPLRVMDLLYADIFPRHLLERLSIGEVLALHQRSPEDVLAEMEEIPESFEAFMDEDLIDDIEEIRIRGLDSPFEQPIISTLTDVLYYFYDFGDGWKIRITGSEDACDLVEQGRITQDELDDAIVKVYETYRPVCIASDGLSLVDDAGGIHGFVSFLRSTHPTEEKDYWNKDGREGNMPDNSPYDTKQSSLIWAKSLGWKEKVNTGRLV